uniref:Uncharacterized protein n=1 Tax=mine drainage metagenome TaxID=410659 RepID=E6PD47_9ZZZZ
MMRGKPAPFARGGGTFTLRTHFLRAVRALARGASGSGESEASGARENPRRTAPIGVCPPANEERAVQKRINKTPLC